MLSSKTANALHCLLTLTIVASSAYAHSPLEMKLPADYSIESVELSTLKKMFSLEGEKQRFYRITEIQTTEITDSYYRRPALRTRISYETPQCRNNYYEGTAFSVDCTSDHCPVAIVYQKCF